MPSYINAAQSGSFATILIRNSAATPGTWALGDFLNGTTGDRTVATNTLIMPALQDITVTNNANTFRWRELAALSEKVVTTVSTNSVSGNFVLDPETFFGTGTGTEATGKGLFNLGNDKQLVYFLVSFDGYDTSSGNALNDNSRYIGGQGYLTSVAPAVSADSPVWVSPFTIEVTGDFVVGAVTGSLGT